MTFRDISYYGWSKVDIVGPRTPGYDDRGITYTNIVSDMDNANSIVACGYISSGTLGSGYCNWWFVRGSKDGGKTWASMDLNFGENHTKGAYYTRAESVAISGNTILVGGYNYTESGTIRKSEDFGNSWSTIQLTQKITGIIFSGNSYVASVGHRIGPAATTNFGVIKSSDKGSTWVTLLTSSTGNGSVSAFGVKTDNQGYLYAYGRAAR